MPGEPEATQYCEMEDCEKEAEGWVEGQWSLFDFVRYEGCYEHLPVMSQALWRRRVEGSEEVDVHVHYYQLIR